MEQNRGVETGIVVWCGTEQWQSRLYTDVALIQQYTDTYSRLCDRFVSDVRFNKCTTFTALFTPKFLLPICPFTRSSSTHQFFVLSSPPKICVLFSETITFVSIGILVSCVLPLAEMVRKAPNPVKQTQITLEADGKPNSGGSVPHMAVWDENIVRVTQFNGDRNGRIGDKSGNTITFTKSDIALWSECASKHWVG